MIDKYTALEWVEWSNGRWLSGMPGHVGDVSSDTRRLNAGDIYIALRGENFDGHDFVNEAFRKGACAAMVMNDYVVISGRKAGTAGPLLVVEDTGKSLCDVAYGYRMKVDPDTVAITGSAGKSTVKEMIAQILNQFSRTAATRGNWNNDIGLPLSLLSMASDTEVGVFEIGTNHPGEIASLTSILMPDWGVITNAGPVHIEYFGSVEAVAMEKASMLKGLAEDGTAVLNADDPCLATFVSSAGDRKILTVSMHGEADYHCINKDSDGEIVVRESLSDDEVSLRLPVPGAHNVLNALMAIAVARECAAEWPLIKSGLEKYKPLPMRWEEKVVGEVRIINDAYNANPLSMRASIDAFDKERVSGGKWLVLAGMLELGTWEKQEHISLGEYVGEGSWAGVVLVGDPGSDIARGIETTGYDRNKIYVCVNNTEAAEILGAGIAKGDAVLFKASRGMKLEEIIERLGC